MNQAVLDSAPATGRRTSAEVRAALTFITPSDTKPAFHSSAYTGGAPRVFFDTERHTVAIEDMRPLAGALSLDHEGFELLRHETAVRDLYDDDAVEKVYYPEIEALLRAVTGASRVVVSTPPGAPMPARARRTGTGCAARRAGCTSTTPQRAARSGSRICLARPTPRGSPRPAPGSSSSTSGARSAGPWSARRWRWPTLPPFGLRT
jgi:hypothetical protein